MSIYVSDGQPVVDPARGIVYPFTEAQEMHDLMMLHGHEIRTLALVKGIGGDYDRLIVEALPRRGGGRG